MKNILSLGMAFFAGLLLQACHSQKPAEEQEPVHMFAKNKLHITADAMANLHFAEAQIKDFPEVQPLMGKISPTEDRTFIVQARAAGRIETVLVASGENVTEGQELGTVFSPDFIAAREEYIQSARKAKGSGQEGDSDFSGLASLARKKLLSMGLLPKDLALLDKANAQVSGSPMAASPEMNMIVRATRSGAIIAKNAVVGNQVNQGDPLFTIADMHQVWFVGDLYPEDLSKAKNGQEVILGGTPNGDTLKGKVSFISPVVDPNTRTIKIRVVVPNPKLELRSDMYLQGDLVLRDKQELIVPTSSIFKDQADSYVFRVLSAKAVEGGHASGVDVERVKVAIASERSGYSAISTGLSSGDQVVSDGGLLLNAALSGSDQ